MKNNKGFTLVELLAVIVILGVVMSIAIPTYTGIINNSKKDAFVTVAKNYVGSVTLGIDDGTFKAPVLKNDVTIVNINMIDLHSGEYASPYNSPWVDEKSYVAVINVGTEMDPSYKYYFAAQDEERNAIPLTELSNINRSSVMGDARNTMEVTVQSLAGNVTGNTTKKGIVSGLDNIVDEDGNKIDWNVTIYSK